MTLLKRLALSLTACLTTASSLADSAHLEAHVTGTRKDNTWFLCLPGERGCYSLHAASAGRVFPLGTEGIQQAYLLNAHTLRLTPQILPAGCTRPIKENQTLRLSGKLHTDAYQQASIQHLHCELAG